MAKKQKTPIDAGKAILQEVTDGPAPSKGGNQKRRQVLLIPALAVVTGLLIGAIIILLTTEEVYAGFRTSFGAGMSAVWNSVAKAYGALFAGAFGNPVRMVQALFS